MERINIRENKKIDDRKNEHAGEEPRKAEKKTKDSHFHGNVARELGAGLEEVGDEADRDEEDGNGNEKDFYAGRVQHFHRVDS